MKKNTNNKNWQQLKRKTIYENPWISLYEDDVITPQQNKSIYSIIEFKNKAGAAIPIDENGFTWLVGQYRYALDRYSWELPMGGVEVSGVEDASAQDILIGTQRELREETGIVAQKWTEILRFDTIQSFGKEEAIVFVAQDLSFGELETEDTEDLQVKRMHINEAIDMALNGALTDGITLAGLFKFATLKQQFDL